jgi:hypothetical protein
MWITPPTRTMRKPTTTIRATVLLLGVLEFIRLTIASTTRIEPKYAIHSERNEAPNR